MGSPRFLDLAEKNLLSRPTLEALASRLPEPSSSVPKALSREAFATLVAVCELLRPPYERPTALEIALGLDARVFGESDGWRYDALPPDAEAYERGLGALDAEACALEGKGFSALGSEEASRLIRLAQKGETTAPEWEGVPPMRFFEELLAGLAVFVYSRPWAQDAIGYVGYADARGWRQIGPNEREDWEL